MQWSGSDDANGSALLDYTVYVADNGGAYAAWLTDTMLTEADYIGASGHSYAFYSVARDNAGNVEAVPAVPDAVTTAPDTIPPTVTRVLVASSDWSSDFLNSLGGVGYAIPDGPNQVSLPGGNLNKVILEFSEDVHVAEGDLVLTGVNVPNYGFSALSYDAVAHRATWTISRNLPDDKLLVDLNGSTANAVVDMAGNRLDGDFQFRVNVLPGDVNQDGTVDVKDLEVLAANYRQSVLGWANGDFNCDGVVNVLDLAVLAANYRHTLGGLSLSGPALDMATILGSGTPTPPADQTTEEPPAASTPAATDVATVPPGDSQTNTVTVESGTPTVPANPTAGESSAALVSAVTDVIAAPPGDSQTNTATAEAGTPTAPANQTAGESSAALVSTATDVIAVQLATVRPPPRRSSRAPTVPANPTAGESCAALVSTVADVIAAPPGDSQTNTVTVESGTPTVPANPTAGQSSAALVSAATDVIAVPPGDGQTNTATVESGTPTVPANPTAGQSSAALVSTVTDVIAVRPGDSQTNTVTVESGTPTVPANPTAGQSSAALVSTVTDVIAVPPGDSQTNTATVESGTPTVPANPTAGQSSAALVSTVTDVMAVHPPAVGSTRRLSSLARQPCLPTRRPANLLPPWCPPSPMSSLGDSMRVRLAPSPTQRPSWHSGRVGWLRGPN